MHTSTQPVPGGPAAGFADPGPWLTPEVRAAVHRDTARQARALLRDLRLSAKDYLPVIFAAPTGRMMVLAMPVAEMMDRIELEAVQAEIAADNVDHGEHLSAPSPVRVGG